MQEWAKSFYKSKAWQKTRAAYSNSVAGLCERCLAKGIIKPGEIVHHKIKLTPQNINNPAVSLSWKNLELLCRDCHGKAHSEGKRYTVDETGRVSIR